MASQRASDTGGFRSLKPPQVPLPYDELKQITILSCTYRSMQKPDPTPSITPKKFRFSPKVHPHDLKVRGDLQIFIDDVEYAKFFECLKLNLEMRNLVPPLSYYNDYFIPLLQRGKALELTYVVAAIMREIAAKFPPTFSDPSKCWSPLTDKYLTKIEIDQDGSSHERKQKENKKRQHWERLQKVLKGVKGDPLPEAPEDQRKQFGPEPVRRLGYRIFLEICTEILEFDLDNVPNRKDTMMYKLLLESGGKRDQRTIVDLLFEMLRAEEIFSETDTNAMENLIVVQRLLAVMIRAVEEKPQKPGSVRRAKKTIGLKKKSSGGERKPMVKREKSREEACIDPEMDLGGMSPEQVTPSTVLVKNEDASGQQEPAAAGAPPRAEDEDDELDPSLSDEEEWFETIALALKKLPSMRRRILFFDTMGSLRQKGKLLHVMLRLFDAKGAVVKTVEELTPQVLQTYFMLHKSPRLQLKHLIDFALIVTLLITVEAQLHNSSPSLLAPLLTELRALQELLGEEDAPFELRLCIWEAARLCGSKDPEPEKTADDIEDEEEEEKAAGVIKREKMTT